MIESKITIGILNYNGIDRLKKSIPSILKQTYKNKEILVVDNGSDDGSLEYLKSINDIVIIENNKNIGYGKAKNILVNQSSGEYILMLDNDIEIEQKDFLLKLYQSYISLKKESLLSVLVKDFDKNYLDSIGLYHNKTQKKVLFKDVLGKGIKQVGGYHGNQVFFLKKLFKKLGGFDEIYPFNIDDYDLSARANIYGYKTLVNTNLYVIHRGIDTRINAKSLCWKNQYYLSGFSRTIWKNYKIKNIIIRWPITSIWIAIKSFKITIKTKSLCPLITYFKSAWFFIRDFGDTLKKRKLIQKNRTEQKDLFLKIRKYIF